MAKNHHREDDNPAKPTRRPHGCKPCASPMTRKRDSFTFVAPNGCLLGVRELQMRYLDGRLRDVECDVVDRHLLTCRCCENSWDARMAELEAIWAEDCDGDAEELSQSEACDDDEPEFCVEQSAQ